MNGITARRMTMAGLGMVGGLATYGLGEIASAELLPHRLLLAVIVLTGTFFTALLIMAGPLRPARAALGALGIALAVTALAVLASLRFEEAGDAFRPHIVVAGLVLATVPMPFWIARSLGAWRDYPTLFAEAWSIVVRYAIAWAFVGMVWGVIFLSDALLDVVGLSIIGDVLDIAPVPYLISGAVLGLGLAVVQELQDYVSPYLVLRLLRLILPAVLIVVALFLLALPVRGLSGLFDGLSVALVMLAMLGVGASLVTTAVDQDDAQATTSTILLWSSRALALLLPILAAVGIWAIWLRVADYGWTPERLFAAEVAALGLGYGLLYALAVLRGPGWMERIRQANVTMALALLALAALTLTPILNSESLSAQSHLARYQAGTLPPEKVDPRALERWGHAGQDALATLRELAKEPDHARLAKTLEGQPDQAIDTAALIAQLQQSLVLQPPTATATRDLFLAELAPYTLQALLDACALQMPGGGQGCVMVVADLMPREPGEEAILLQWVSFGAPITFGLVQGRPAYDVTVLGMRAVPDAAAGAELIRSLQSTPPTTEPAPLNRLSGSGLMLAD